MIRRLDGWEIFLDDYLMKVSGFPWSLGKWDCGSFAGGAIRAMTGEDIESSIRPTVDLREVIDKGIESIVIAQMARLDVNEVTGAFAGRGDLVLLRNSPELPCLGIVGLNGQPMKVGSKGLVSVGREDILRAWKI